MPTYDVSAIVRRLGLVSRRSLVAAAAAFVLGSAAPAVIAAPGMGSVSVPIQAQNVDWMSTSQAASLDVGIDVLVPSWVPAPFDAVTPSISASGGYYQLYWMVSGGAPTFLQITGVAGGSLPAGSPADLNNQLFINASVQGWDAIHDIGIPAGSETPIYDQVWWIANGVLYSVSSLNMTGSDTLSLANSLMSLDVPVASETEVPVEEPEVPVETEVPVESEPQVSVETATQVPEEVPSDSTSGSGAETPETSPGGATESATSESIVETVVDASVSNVTDTLVESPTRAPAQTPTPSSTVGGTAASASGVPSDGTAGPPPPIFGGDGTGGVQDVVIPRDARSR